MFQRANIKQAYWIIFLFLLVSLASFNLYFIEYQRKLLVDLETSSLQNELEIAAEFIREDIAAERFQHIEPFFQLWAHRNHKIISIKAIADNGFVLTEHELDNSVTHTIKLDKEIDGPVGLSLEVIFDLTDVEQEIHDLTILFILSDIAFIFLLMILLWLIMQSYLVKPLRNSENKYINLATKDPLTKINNRRAFYELGNREISRCKRHTRPLCMLTLDLDHFKHINDNFGHQVGDHILQLITTEIDLMIRETDVLGRMGGEEFSLCLPELTLTTAALTAERLRLRIESLPPLKLDDKVFPLTVSIGLTVMQEKDNIDSLLQRADELLYKAKEQGRNCIVTDEN